MQYTPADKRRYMIAMKMLTEYDCIAEPEILADGRISAKVTESSKLYRLPVKIEDIPIVYTVGE